MDHAAGGVRNLLEERVWDLLQDAQDSKDEVQDPVAGGMHDLVDGLQGLAAYLRCGIYGVWKGR